MGFIPFISIVEFLYLIFREVFSIIKSQWITEGITGDYLKGFANLLDKSNELVIDHKTGEFVRLRFIMDAGDLETVIFPPLKQERSHEEIEKIIRELENDPETQAAMKRHDEFFTGIDLKDETAVLDRIAEWVNKINAGNRTNVRDLSAVMRWNIILKKATLLAGFLGCDCEVLENDEDYDGSVTLYISQDDTKTIRVFGKTKDLFVELLNTSVQMDLEMSVEQGFTNIAFYA